MRRFVEYSVCFFAVAICLTSSSNADVILTFDQSGIFDTMGVDQAYGDRVIASPDSAGHSYDIIAGNGLGLTPNVEVDYIAGEPKLWTTGYGDLTNVFYDEIDFSTSFEIEFSADPGFEVGIFGFEMAAFGAGETLPGIEILDGDNTILWSVGPTFITGSDHNSFDTGGVFAESLTITVDLTGLGGSSDNIGIDNVHFGQRLAAVPEPSGAVVLVGGVVGLLFRRRRCV